MKDGSDYKLLSKLYLTFDTNPFITPERIALLKSIAQTGSISAGAKAINRSYKWAWDSITQMNACSTTLLVTKANGGRGGGGAKITSFAHELVNYYVALEQIHQRKVVQYQKSFTQAFERQHLSNTFASTLHGTLEAISHGVTMSTLSIHYGDTILKAKTEQADNYVVGDDVTFMVESNQIIIANAAVSISAQNLLIGHIHKMTQDEETVYLYLMLQTGELLSVLITQEALEQLALCVGQTCYAYFKTHTITVVGEENV